ncbi:hypothetical protein DEO23_04445 [Brachybacterium endophyticum]|uniref:UspA domain-containing protein n=1 Tax=Brachybacterium endophyticum TaxID=2182385 RepID=A0A2U2RPS8_9MICO|nr:universal stress protein [Brachybacterium endophyticum]PWH07860.1 hypothetical protein DEO23_04445 [Brachybacterium endophyticum]
MSILVGFGPDTRSGSGLRLAAALARSLGEPLVLCCVIHDAFGSPTLRDFSGVDDDWRRELTGMARETLARAREQLPEDLEVETVQRVGRSVPQILDQEARARGARMLVVGSSDGVVGRIGLGSTSDRLVHSAHVPIALAPRGFDPESEGVSRLVLAVDPTDRDAALVPGVARALDATEAALTIVTFAVRGGSRSAFSAFREGEYYAQWRQDVVRTQGRILDDVRDLSPSTSGTAGSVVEGPRWSAAVSGFDWQQGDMLVIGSSTHASVTRVFLGSTAARILRHSPVPVLVLPRGREITRERKPKVGKDRKGRKHAKDS